MGLTTLRRATSTAKASQSALVSRSCRHPPRRAIWSAQGPSAPRGRRAPASARSARPHAARPPQGNSKAQPRHPTTQTHPQPKGPRPTAQARAPRGPGLEFGTRGLLPGGGGGAPLGFTELEILCVVGLGLGETLGEEF